MAKDHLTPSFLSAAQRDECTRIAEIKRTPHSQRATALLLIDSGSTHREAGAQTGLSIGQVRYALNRFRKFGLAIFPPPPEEQEKVMKKKSKAKITKPKAKKKKKKKEEKKKGKKVKKEKKSAELKKKKGKKKKKDKKKKK